MGNFACFSYILLFKLYCLAGTTSNNKAVLHFKLGITPSVSFIVLTHSLSGAFRPLLPVQPIGLRYGGWYPAEYTIDVVEVYAWIVHLRTSFTFITPQSFITPDSLSIHCPSQTFSP